MNKKANSVFFILAATAFNIILVGVIFVALLSVYGLLLQKLIPEGASWYILASFIASIVGGFFLYRIVVKAFSKRVDFDKYFDPLFLPRRK